jgi:hypothetical protein
MGRVVEEPGTSDISSSSSSPQGRGRIRVKGKSQGVAIGAANFEQIAKQ